MYKLETILSLKDKDLKYQLAKYVLKNVEKMNIKARIEFWDKYSTKLKGELLDIMFTGDLKEFFWIEKQRHPEKPRNVLIREWYNLIDRKKRRNEYRRFKIRSS